MKISVSTWSLNNYGFECPEQLVDFAAENSIEALDLTLDDYERYFPWRDKSVAEVEKHFSALGKYAAGKGVEIFQTHAPYALFPDYIGEKFLETTRKALIATRAAGAFSPPARCTAFAAVAWISSIVTDGWRSVKRIFPARKCNGKLFFSVRSRSTICRAKFSMRSGLGFQGSMSPQRPFKYSDA